MHYDVVLDVKDVACKKRKVENNLDVRHSCKKLKTEQIFSMSGTAEPKGTVHTKKAKETIFCNTFSSKKQTCFEIREKDVNSVDMKLESENVSEPLLNDISGL